MSEQRVTVVDYGIGNLYSVQRAFETCGAAVQLTSDASDIEAAECLILPGVGAFSDGMAGLRERGLVEPLRRYASSGRPLVGICLGMQMLASVSEEFGEHEGLGVIPGRVVPIPVDTTKGGRHKIPRVGWSALEIADGATWQGTPLADTTPGTAVYLVHSYHVVADDPSHLLAYGEYGGHRISAAIRAGNVFGFQFHPERSGPEGLRILRALLSIAAR